VATTNVLNDTGTKMNAQTKNTTKNNRRVHEGEMFVVGEFYASSETFQVIIIMSIMKGQQTKRSCQVKRCQLSGASQATKQKSRIFALFCHPFLYVCPFSSRKHTHSQPVLHKKGGCTFCGREAATAKGERVQQERDDRRG